MVPTKKNDSNSRTFQDFFSLFPGLSAKFQDFPELSGSCTNSNNKLPFLQNKNIHPVVYITAPSTVKAKINIFGNTYYIL